MQVMKIRVVYYRKMPPWCTFFVVFLHGLAQVLNLFDEALEPPTRVAFEGPDEDATVEDATMATMMRVAFGKLTVCKLGNRHS